MQGRRWPAFIVKRGANGANLGIALRNDYARRNDALATARVATELPLLNASS